MPFRALVAAAAIAAVSASAPSCATPFDANTDYFADASSRFTPTSATTFSIDYNRYYKKINVTSAAGGTRIIALRVCGAPQPTNADLGLGGSDVAVHLELPLTRAAVLSTTQLPWIEVGGRG